MSGSAGCERCYAETFTERWRGTPGHYFQRGFDVQLRPEKLELPLRWKRPRRVFVNSLADLFHKAVSDDYVARVFAVMAQAPRHTFQVLTKRPGRMRALLSQSDVSDRSSFAAKIAVAVSEYGGQPYRWPLPNVWVGTSAEEQKWAQVRVPVLLDTPAAVRFLSAEPLLGPLDLTSWLGSPGGAGLDWVIVGGETGRGARPMHPDWARGIRYQCGTAATAFFFKQWGGWRLADVGHGGDGEDRYPDRPRYRVGVDGSAREAQTTDARAGEVVMLRVRPSVAGRTLDGRTWDDFPPGQAAAAVTPGVGG